MGEGPDRAAAKAPGPQSSKRRRAGIVAALGIAALAIAGVTAVVLDPGAEEGEDKGGPGATPALSFGPPGAVDPKLSAALQGVAAALPSPTGATDRDQIRSLLGPPDTFEVAFEPASADAEQLVRRETWVYLDLTTAYEFIDGDLLTNLPAEVPPGIGIVPLQYDPADFSRETTPADVEALLVDPTAVSRTELPAALGAKLTALAGEQLLAVFDEGGRLVLVQSFVLSPGGQE